MNSNELAKEVTGMNFSVMRCLHYLVEELPESRKGDYQVLLNDVQSKYSKLVAATGSESRQSLMP